MKPYKGILPIQLLLLICLCAVTGCEKPYTLTPADTAVTTPQPSFVKYLIKKGRHYANDDSTKIVIVKTSEMKFIVKFDSSAIYQTVLASNQGDINKLYGFSDNNTFHHYFSARFGWNWLNDGLHLWGYNYNDSIREFKDLGVVPIDQEINCSIRVQGKQYVFVLNGKETAMRRTSPTVKGEGYQLFPFFGGKEPAPHDITIYIRDL